MDRGRASFDFTALALRMRRFSCCHPPFPHPERSGIFLRMQEAKAWLPRLMPRADRRYSYSVSSVLGPARDAVKNVQPAPKKIEQWAFVPKTEGDLDLGKTEDVIEMEKGVADTPLSSD
jgi:hypothetical protein